MGRGVGGRNLEHGLEDGQHDIEFRARANSTNIAAKRGFNVPATSRYNTDQLRKVKLRFNFWRVVAVVMVVGFIDNALDLLVHAFSAVLKRSARGPPIPSRKRLQL